MEASTSISSSLAAQNDLLSTIASLRAQLAQTQAQLNHAKAQNNRLSPSLGAGTSGIPIAADPRRLRRVSTPATSSSTAADGYSVKHSNQSTSSVVHSPGGHAAQFHQQQQRRRALSGSSPLLGYVGAPPSSLAAPATIHAQPDSPHFQPGSPASTSGLPPSSSYGLKRDRPYDDLNGVMNAPYSPTSPIPLSPGSPNSSQNHQHILRHQRSRRSSLREAIAANVPGDSTATAENAGLTGLGIGRPATSTARRRSTSISNSSDGGRSATGAAASSTRIPAPVIPRGSVGTAATLAGGATNISPKHAERTTGSSSTLRVSVNGRRSPLPNGQSSPGFLPDVGEVDELDMAQRGPSTSLPPTSSQSGTGSRAVSPAMRHARSSDSDDRGTGMHGQLHLQAPRSGAHNSSVTSPRTASSPFFGGSAGFTERHAARIASSQSGTTKVIMGLQTELTSARTQLDSTKSQLRASARAVEALTRQVEDHKESRERQRLEAQNLSSTLARRERMLEETLARARAAEASSRSLEEEKKSHTAECSKRIRELEQRVKEAEERRAKAESEYGAMRSATASLTDGWKRELRTVKKEQAAIRLMAEKDTNAARSRQASTAKLIANRASAQAEITAALEDQKRWQEAVQKQYEVQLQACHKRNEDAERENASLRRQVDEVLLELQRYRRAMTSYDPDTAKHS